MAYSSIQNAIDYYINLLEDISTKSIVPPALEFAELKQPIAGETNLYVKKIYRKDGYSISKIVIFVSGQKLDSRDITYLGPITDAEYKSLDDEFEIAISEFRRKNFSKISRKQRHAPDEDRRVRAGTR